ncbi:MAG: hypothetical protein KH436_03185 [Firmicutes bacterium]|jgi:lipoprotein|nr:hypothetical protein [Bacillota bacterium]
MSKKLFSFFMAFFLLFSVGAGCRENPPAAPQDARRNLSAYEFSMASLSATDKFGREIAPMGYLKTDRERFVGLFYWMWISNTNYYYHNIFDCTKLMSTEEGAAAFWNIDPSNAAYQQLSQIGAFHFTNEPLYGYYNSSDPWVITRHMELFILAGIDFIFLDTSNSLIYDEDIRGSQFEGVVKAPSYTLLDTMLELYEKGWDVPKVVFLTNTRSGERVEEIRRAFYDSGKYEALWFKPDGVRPMIIATTEQNDGASDTWGDVNKFVPVSAADQLYFDVKETQWPNKGSKPNGFPWISNRAPQTYHEESKAISVSVAQHGNLGFTDMIDRNSRGYNYKEQKVEENWQLGQNFENQWDTVFSLEEKGTDVTFVNVTGWNEWVGMKFGNLDSKAVMVDNFYGQYTRDIEPDKTLYQDTTLLQLTRNLRKFKYEPAAETYLWKTKTVRAFEDFEDVPAVYVDFEGDALARDYWSFDVKPTGPYYTDATDRNDILETRVVHDGTNLYFLVTTKEDVTAYESGDNWMNILIKTEASTEDNSFAGYNFAVNRAPDGNTTSVEKSTGGWNWESAGAAELLVEGNRMMITVPLSTLGLSADNVKFSFKVADNVQKPSWFAAEDAEHDILHYYATGDSAPLGRYSYSYGY